MKQLNLITLLLVIIGGLNWLLIGLFNFNLVSEIFGSFSRLIYVLVGLSALYQLIPFWQAVSTDEVIAEQSRRVRRDL
jgi:uncharacterized membrane protein YuzA (DUF378 family)